MKKKLFLQSFICLLAVSCTVRELDVVTPTPNKAENMVFYAELESSEADTKVYLDENIKILWDAGDLISIFNESTLNQQFMFDGETGENAGTFHWVDNGYFGAGNDLDHIYAVYPYRESTTISNADVLTLTLPSEQTYRPNSFGPGANTMVSKTDSPLLKFKNVGGYLALKFYGSDVTVKTITLAGNSGEPLAGEATLALPFGDQPMIEMAQNAKKTIYLDCGEDGVVLGESAEDATIFWMVVPPTDFTQGFTLTVTDTNGDVFVKQTTKPLSIARNGVLRIKAIEVDMDSEALFLKDVAPVDVSPHKTEIVESARSVTVTLPTVTDFSDLLFNYTLLGCDKVLVNGIPLVNGETRIDASGEKTYVVVHDGRHGKRYQLFTKNTGLPVVRIKTTVLSDGSEGFSLAYLEEPKNRLQYKDEYPRDTTLWVDERKWLPETKGKYVTFRVENPDGSPGMKTKDGVPVYEIDTQIKGRGNYSWKWEKKPYALKFDKKTEVLGMPVHKRWALLANWRDRTLLRNDATFWLAKKAHEEIPYTTSGQFVELVFNGEYRGNYYLCEQIKIDENRVNITPLDDNLDDMSGGFLMEIDSYWDEVNKFKSQYFNLRYMFKEPDEDPKAEGTDARYGTAYSTMKNYINAFEKVVKTRSAVVNGDGLGQYADYLDVDSAIMFMLLNELVGNGDFFQTSTDEVFGPHSTYLYKDKGNSPLFMGPVWDFDYLTFTPKPTYGNFSWKGYDSKKYYYYFLSADQEFVDRIKYLWSLYKADFANLPDYIDEMVAKIGLSQEFDEARWPYDSQYDQTTQKNRNDNKDYSLSYSAAITRMKESFTARFNWLDGKISNLTKTNPTYSQYSSNTEWMFP